MRTFLPKPEVTQQTTAASSKSLVGAHSTHGHNENLILHLQRTIGNQAVQRLMETNTGEVKGVSTAAEIFGHAHEVSPVPTLASSSIGGQHVSRASSSNGDTRGGNTHDGRLQATELTVSDGPETVTATHAEESASRGVATAEEQSAPVADAPSATYIVPFDRSPLAAPGERIIFRAQFTDPSPSAYQLEYTGVGGHFNSASGPVTLTIPGLISGNVNFFVQTPWDGVSTVQVVLRVRKISDNSVAQTEVWNFSLKTRYPTTMTQREGTGERSIPAVYNYDIGPVLTTGTAPFYQHQTILERFGNWTLANIVPADIAPAYRTTHSLTTAAAVSQHFLGNYAGNNGTFTVDAQDRIADQHGGHPNLSNLVANLAAPKDIEVALPQTYEAQPGTALGNYTVTRILKADGTTWRVRKG